MIEVGKVKGNYMGVRPVNIGVLEGNELREAGSVILTRMLELTS